MDPFTFLFSFQGRATRLQFWMVHLLGLILPIVMFFIVAGGSLANLSEFASNDPDAIDKSAMVGDAMTLVGAVVLTVVLFLVATIVNWALAVRRLHDMNYSAWWLTLFFAPMGVTLFFWISWGLNDATAMQQTVTFKLFAVAVSLTYFIWFGCFSGTPRGNAYGGPIGIIAAPYVPGQINPEDLDPVGAWADAPVAGGVAFKSRRDTTPVKPPRKRVAQPMERPAGAAQGFGRRGL